MSLHMSPAEEDRVRSYMRYLLSIGRAGAAVEAIRRLGTAEMAEDWAAIYEEMRETS